MFITNYSKLAKPLIALTGKRALFSWGKEEELTFKVLKDKFCKAPVLA
jgi:hypothetical protein